MPTAPTRFLAGVALAALVACTPNAVTNVTIDGGDRTIVLGDPLTLSVTVAVLGSANTTVTWASTDETVATIDANGTVLTVSDGTTDITATSATDPTKNDTITLTVRPLGELRWTDQFGTSGSDFARGIATDADGNVYATGNTDGDLEGASAGGNDAFIRAYDQDGNLRWTRQFGTTGADVATGITTDANGNVYATGYTGGDLEGPNAGSFDAYVRAYDVDGDLRWSRQFGTSSADPANGIATDADGNVYATGYTQGALEGLNAGRNDAFIRSYGR